MSQQIAYLLFGPLSNLIQVSCLEASEDLIVPIAVLRTDVNLIVLQSRLDLIPSLDFRTDQLSCPIFLRQRAVRSMDINLLIPSC